MHSAVTGKPLPLLGGALCLDFVNTIDPRLAPPHEDFLATFEDLARWGRYVGVLSAGEERALLAAGADDPALAARVHARAFELREALYQLFRPGSRRRPTKALDVVNRELARTAASRVLVAARGRYQLAWRARSADDRLLGTIAQSASDLLVSATVVRVRECAGDGCGWLFVDTSKAHRRRWCSMQICGNRAKARRHRERRRKATFVTSAQRRQDDPATAASSSPGSRRTRSASWSSR